MDISNFWKIPDNLAFMWGTNTSTLRAITFRTISRALFRTMFRTIFCVMFGVATLFSTMAQAQVSKPKVMILTSTYGVLAGTLTGMASLAFYRNPGTKLRNVALGASLGLYTGIGLGLYLIYFDPGARKQMQRESDEDEDIEEGAWLRLPGQRNEQIEAESRLAYARSQSSLIDGRRLTPLFAFAPGAGVELGFQYQF